MRKGKEGGRRCYSESSRSPRRNRDLLQLYRPGLRGPAPVRRLTRGTLFPTRKARVPAPPFTSTASTQVRPRAPAALSLHAMLSFAGLALRQCTQRAALRSLPARPARTFATHPVLCQHYPSHTPVQPQWTDNGKHFSRNSRVAYQWEFVTDISERYTKTLASKTPEEIWSSWENGLVKNLPPPHHAYSGVLLSRPFR